MMREVWEVPVVLDLRLVAEHEAETLTQTAMTGPIQEMLLEPLVVDSQRSPALITLIMLVKDQRKMNGWK